MNLNRWPPTQISSDPVTGICPRDQSPYMKSISYKLGRDFLWIFGSKGFSNCIFMK